MAVPMSMCFWPICFEILTFCGQIISIHRSRMLSLKTSVTAFRIRWWLLSPNVNKVFVIEVTNASRTFSTRVFGMSFWWLDRLNDVIEMQSTKAKMVVWWKYDGAWLVSINCLNFSQNHFKKTTFSPLFENKISTGQNFYLKYIYLFWVTTTTSLIFLVISEFDRRK